VCGVIEPGLAKHLTALDVFALDTAQQRADVVARLALIEQLAEHLDTGAGGLDGVFDADDGNLFTDLDHAALDTSGHHGATPGDREDVFDRHQEGAVDGALGLGDVAVERIHELVDGQAADLAFIAFQRLERRAGDDRGVVAGEFVAIEQLAHFHLDQFQQLGVVDHVGLVQVDDDVGHAHLAREQDVLARLRHRAVSGGHHQDRTVHLRRAR
jgi:hypothetical protein